MNLMSPSVFDEIGHIEIDVVKVSDVVLFHILHVVEVEHELVNTIITEHDIKDIVNEINVNHDLKGAVKTVMKPLHIEFPINLVKVPVIHIKLFFKLKPDVVRGQPVKESRQDNEPILMSLRKQGDDILITGLIQQCSMHHVCERDPI